MTTTIIESQEDLDALFYGIAEQWNGMPIGPYLLAEMQNIEAVETFYFAQEISPQRRKWAPLAESTIARKGHERILHDTGRLEQSLTGNSPDAIRRVTSSGNLHTLEFGTSVEYAIYHLTGTANMPARVHLGLNPAFLDGMAERLADYALTNLQEV